MSDVEKSIPQPITAPASPSEVEKRKGGRPSKREALIREKLLSRKPMVRGKNLEGEVPEGTVGRWVNDRPGRIQSALQHGYMFVDATTATAGDNKNKCRTITELTKENLARRVTRRVDTNVDGSGLTAYLMCIETEINEIDQQRKQAVNDQIMQGIERNIPSAETGEDSTTGTLNKAEFSVTHTKE